MKTWIKVGMVGVLSITLTQAAQTKLYEIESGKISYEIKGSGNLMGTQTKSIGKKRLIFDDYGAKSLTEENKIQKTTVMGQTQTDKTHTMTYLKDATIYHVDFDNKKITRMENMGAMMMGGGDMSAKGKEMMQKMGGKMLGMDKVLGYECEVWELMGVKQCIYKGVTLKIESNMMGMKNVEIATEAEFDISVDEDDFKLPDFPMTDQMGASISKNKLEKMDADDQKEMQDAQAQLAAMMGAMAAAAQDAGVKKGQQPSMEQMEAMQDSMRSSALPMAKQQILSEEPMFRKGRKCLEDADTLKEAKACEEKFGGGDEDEPLTDWSAETQQSTLKEIDQYLNVIVPCVKKAQSMDGLEQCMN